MEKIIRFSGNNPRKEYRFAVYEHKMVTADGLSFIRSFIVLKNQYGVIVRFTRLHNYTGAYSNKTVRPLASDANARMHYICMMLNYVLIDNYEVYRIDHVFQITKEMLAPCHNPLVRNTIIMFMYFLTFPLRFPPRGM